MGPDRPSEASRQRANAERMLARAQKKAAQAGLLVEKWKQRIAELDRIGVAARQAQLWSDEHFEDRL